MRYIVAFIYFVFFWLLLPAVMVIFSFKLDISLFENQQFNEFWLFPGIILSSAAFSLLIKSVVGFEKYTGLLPVSAFPPKKLVQHSEYAVVRHPIYAYFTLFVFGLAFAFRSYSFVLIIFPAYLPMLFSYIGIEEVYLIKRFGEDYKNYRKRVPSIIPKLYQFFKILLLWYFKFRFRLKIQNRENIPQSPPFFVISNHRNYFDPFYICVAFSYQVRYICTFEMFRKPFLEFFLYRLGAIPRKRYMNDTNGTKQIIQALKEGSPIGIFPEGERSWTGELCSLKPETIKLLKKYKHIPIVPVRLVGNYHAWPRWSRKMLKSPVSVSIEKPIFLNENQSPEEIEHLLSEKIAPVYETVKNSILPYPGDVTRFLYRCPACMITDVLKPGERNMLICENCATTIHVNYDLTLDFQLSERIIKEGIISVYEKIRIKESDIKSYTERNKNLNVNENVLAKSEDLIAFAICKLWKEAGVIFEPIFEGKCILTSHRLIFQTVDQTVSLTLNDISAATIEGYKKLQIYLNTTEELYQVVFTHESAFKWQDMLSLIIEMKFKKKIIRR